MVINIKINNDIYYLSCTFALKGQAGNPSTLYKLASPGLSLHAYRIATGSFTSLVYTMISLFLISALSFTCTKWNIRMIMIAGKLMPTTPSRLKKHMRQELRKKTYQPVM